VKNISLCHQVVELSFDSCDNAATDGFWNGSGYRSLRLAGAPIMYAPLECAVWILLAVAKIGSGNLEEMTFFLTP
jgi:hypothetical protein